MLEGAILASNPPGIRGISVKTRGKAIMKCLQLGNFG